MDEQGDLKLLAEVFKDKSDVIVHFDVWSLWLLGSACQMTITHPGLSEDLRKKYREIGQMFQAYLKELHPETDHIMEAGWYRYNDVPSRVSTLAPTRNLPSRPMSKKRRNRGKPR